MKKILVIHHGKGIGGGLIALVGLVEELKREYDVDVLSIFQSDAVDYLERNDINVLLPKTFFYKKVYSLFVHSEATYFNILNFVYNIFSFLTFILSKYFFAGKELNLIEEEYDLVYLNSTFLVDWSRSAKMLRKKVVIHVREPLAFGLVGFHYQIIRKSISKYCDRIIAVSFDNSNRINLNKITTVVYDPVVKRKRDKITFIDEKANKTCDVKYFVYVGGYTRIKGFEQLVNALEFLNQDIRILFLGGEVYYSSNPLKKIVRSILDPYYSKHIKLIDKLHNSDNVIKVGLTEDVFRYYQMSTGLISPFSKPHASLPILEAFCIGLPVIVSDIIGMDELVSINNGMFFQNNNSKSLADCINKMALLENEQYCQMKTNALETYKQIKNRPENILLTLKHLIRK